jgi:competence protein ComEC
VDLIVLTHPNSDHLNGLLFILENFKVHKVLSNYEHVDTLSYRQFQKILSERKIVHPAFKDLPRRQLFSEVILEILNPPADFLQRKKIERWRDTNNNSIVLRVVYGNRAMLFPGDLMLPAETALLSEYSPKNLHSNILFAPHHGSKSSNSQGFIRAVAPNIAVISAGWKNPFGFPHKEVLARYQDSGVEVLRVDLCGAVELVFKERKTDIITTLPCRESYPL